MIENGNGTITVKEEYIIEFNKLLNEFYNTGNNNKIEKFIYDNCIYGLTILDNFLIKLEVLLLM